MSNTQDKLDELDQRVTNIEISSAKLDERLNNLVSSTANLKWCLWSITVLLLLTVIYGAVGKDGFNSVTSAYHNHQNTPSQVIYK